MSIAGSKGAARLSLRHCGEKKPGPARTPARAWRWSVLARQVDHVVGEVQCDFIQREIGVLDLFGEHDKRRRTSEVCPALRRFAERVGARLFLNLEFPLLMVTSSRRARCLRKGVWVFRSIISVIVSRSLSPEVLPCLFSFLGNQSFLCGDC